MATSITAERGKPEALGATVEADGVHFAVVSENADAIEVCLFDEAGTMETERLELPGADGLTRFGFVPGLAEGTRYGLRAKGSFDPRNGHRFDHSKLLVDPYALRLDRPFLYEPSLTAPPERELDSAAFLPRAIVTAPARDARPLPFAPPGFTYELLVRAFSQADPDISAELRGTISALAEPRYLDHLARIGIDTIELMPLAAWLDEGHLTARNLTNAWGYNPITHMAPDPRLSPGGLAEIRRTVDALHERGIRVLLDVVFNHSGEGDDEGPTVSYRGLDNKLYYAHEPDRPDALVNVTGTGNTFAAWKEPVARLFADAARSWVETTGIDGFRYDLATVLGRYPDGFREDAPYFRMIAEDPILKDRIHLAEPWDIGMGGYQVGRFPKPFLEWQDRFRDDVRKFWRGEDGRVSGLATRLAGSADLYDREGRKPSASVNFVAAHDGFSLADLVIYEEKHNEANGEGNRDGSNDNHSWNNGAEGPTDDPAIIEARGRDMRALLATLMVARGNPMIVAGDEFGRTQKGNNNGYAQDNEITWLDWARADESLIAFTADLAALRRGHPALSADAFLTGTTQESTLPDLVWRREDGAAMSEPDWHDPARRFLGMDLAAPGTDGATERALVYLNAGRTDTAVTLPPPQPKRRWTLRLQSDWPGLEPRPLDAGAGLVVKARSVFVLVDREEGADDVGEPA